MIRACEWCGERLRPPKERACNDSHRAKAYRYRCGVRRADGSREQPPAGSPLLRGGRTGGVAREARANGGNGRRSSGPQVSYRKALAVLTSELGSFVEPRRVEAALRKALPERQRERLEARG